MVLSNCQQKHPNTVNKVSCNQNVQHVALWSATRGTSSYLLPVIIHYSHSSRNFLLIVSRCGMHLTLAHSWLLHTEGTVLSQFKYDERGVAWFHTFLTSPLDGNAHLHASCKMGTGFFPGVKCGRGVLLATHPLLVPRSWKSRAIPLPTLWATSCQ